jgi:hypothetical protein
MKYLIIKCKELGDQFECDADRTPICVTNDYSKYGYGYEVWEIHSNGSLTKIKEYEDSLEEGMALYRWKEENDPREEEPEILHKDKGKTRDITKSFAKKLKQEVGFKESVNEIFQDIESRGSHAEELNGYWVVYGEYIDNNFSIGY